MITVFEVYGTKDGDKVATHLTEASADDHVAFTNGRTEKRAAEISTFKTKLTFSESYIGKATGTHTYAAARGGKVRSSHAKTVKRNVTITGLAWQGDTLVGVAKVSGYMLNVEYDPKGYMGWIVTGSTKA